ncbi:DUF2807 domain-containing protein [Burkholderiaceae bacterium DAT-1]|nr:DUF2807 domain-containing protein [Burkholderiaceae bacterium DAT-1]
MKQVLFLGASVAMLTACSVKVESDPKTGDFERVRISVDGGVQKSGKHLSETREVAMFDKLNATGSVDCEVIVGDTKDGKPQLIIEGDENQVKRIKTDVSDGTLNVSLNGQNMLVIGAHYQSDDTVVKIVVPKLLAASHTGSGSLKVEGLKGDDFDYQGTGSGDAKLVGKVGKLSVRMNGSGDLDGEAVSPQATTVEIMGSGDARFGHMSADSLSVSIHGSGSVTADGSSKQVSAKVMGSGSAEMRELRAESADLEVWGSGDVSLRVIDKLVASTHGSGNITVVGKPSKSQTDGKNIEFESE